MESKNFELFLGCLGNGMTVCNKAVYEHGDYKTIAHVSPSGRIKLYVSEDYIPPADMEKIRKVAERMKQEFVELWNKKSVIKKYSILINMLPVNESTEKMDSPDIPLEERVVKMQQHVYGI